MTSRIVGVFMLAGLLVGSGCGDDADLLGDIIFGNDQSIDRDLLGVGNEFFANPKGNAAAQANDILFTLGLRHVRTTFFFDLSFLPSESAAPSFSRFDTILASLPEGIDLLPILAYVPSWLANRPDWKDVFIARYVIPVLDRYGNHPRIVGWEIWNEPDLFCNGRNGVPSGVLDCSPEDYVDLARRVAPAIRARSSKPIIGAASGPINTNFPGNLDFNRRMVAAGLLDLIDVYNFHWYSEQLERLALGIEDFLEDTGKPLWCTESGIRGSTRQLEFAETVFPTLADRLDGLERIYIYTYFEDQPPDSSFGLVANDGTESDLYQFLRDSQ